MTMTSDNKDQSAEARLREAVEIGIKELIRVRQLRVPPTASVSKVIDKMSALAATPDNPSASWRKVNESRAGTCWSIFEGDERVVGDLTLEEEADIICEAHNAAIQAACTAPSQDQLDEVWDRGYNAAEERYQKLLAAPSEDTKRLRDAGELLAASARETEDIVSGHDAVIGDRRRRALRAWDAAMNAD